MLRERERRERKRGRERGQESGSRCSPALQEARMSRPFAKNADKTEVQLDRGSTWGQDKKSILSHTLSGHQLVGQTTRDICPCCVLPPPNRARLTVDAATTSVRPLAATAAEGELEEPRVEKLAKPNWTEAQPGDKTRRASLLVT